MTVKVNSLKRVFVDSKTKMELSDPSSSYTPEKVRDFYANTYPHLVNATVEGPEVGKDTLTFKFSSTAGTKG